MSDLEVSVVVPAYNAEATLVRALNSVASQSRPVREVVVVDDASSDRTSDVARSYERLRVKFIRLDKNSGAAVARNIGASAASCELIAFLDADDEWLSQKLEKQLGLLVAKPEATFVSCGSNLIADNGSDLGDIYRGSPIVTGALAWKALLKENFVTTPSVLVRRELFQSLGGFNPALKIAEDQDMWIRLAEKGGLEYIHECLVLVHEQKKSLSSGAFADQLRFTLPMIEAHLLRLRDKLTPSELREIRGSRNLRLGQIAFSRAELRTGWELVLKSALSGYRPLDGLSFLAKATIAAALFGRPDRNK